MGVPVCAPAVRSTLRPGLTEIGILIIDDDPGSQRALMQVLDTEGWRVRIVPVAAHALRELATGHWNLVIVNATLTDLHGPVFAILRELALADTYEPVEETPAPAETNGDGDGDGTTKLQKRLRVLFLIPARTAKDLQPVLERDGLPYLLKPYHLHEFLEKVSELLQEAGALEDPIRSMPGFLRGKKRARPRRTSRDARRGAMFASREDYQMTEEELVEWERQEEEERKKRQKEQKQREHLG
jgi:DNA-binding response OmpR family regulator